MILAVLAFAKYSTWRSWTETFAIFFPTFRFLALATSFYFIQPHPDLKCILIDGLFVFKSLWVSRKSINNRFLMAFIGGAVSTFNAIAVLVAKYLKMKTLTIHFKAFRFTTIATNLLKFGYFLGALFLSNINFLFWSVMGRKTKDRPFPRSGRLFDIHHRIFNKLFAFWREQLKWAIKGL